MDTLLEGVSRKELAARALAISTAYRSGGGSAGVVADEFDTLAYVVARLPATYAAAMAVMSNVRDCAAAFGPKSLLDVGAGPATASWAAREIWPGLEKLALADSNASFLSLAQKLSPSPDAELLARDLCRDDLPSADLVVAGYVLAEIPAAAQHAVVDKLFEASRDALIFIEPGTPEGFARIRDARTNLIAKGANVLGPCTHANACPMAGTDWCHFSQRLPRSRDHMHAKGASVPYEDERYAWLAVGRTRRSAFEGMARVLSPPKETKPGLEFKLCTPAGLENRMIARRDKETYARVRRIAWGDVSA